MSLFKITEDIKDAFLINSVNNYLNAKTCRTSVGVKRQVRGPEFGPQ